MKAGDKSVGEVFDLLWTAGDAGREERSAIVDVARMTTYAENAIWMAWRINDPITATNMVERRQVKASTGKWPKMELYKLEATPDGNTPTKIAGALCPGLYSYVYDAIANHVRKLYCKKRLAYLRFAERLPIGDHLRIRFRERCVQIQRAPDHPGRYRLALRLLRDSPPLELGIKTVGKSPHTMSWLANMADTGGNPSGGTISAKRRRGKLCWQISLARARQPGERQAVSDPVKGRTLEVFAPLDQEVFLWCEVIPAPTPQPWRCAVESSDLVRVKRRHEGLRRSMGRNYRQSRGSAAHGHGRRRAIKGKLTFAERYEQRANSWIEQRSAFVVDYAAKCRCERIRLEDLTTRNPETLVLGSFPYFKLLQRIEQKAKERGIKCTRTDDLESIKARLGCDNE